MMSAKRRRDSSLDSCESGPVSSTIHQEKRSCHGISSLNRSEEWKQNIHTELLNSTHKSTVMSDDDSQMVTDQGESEQNGQPPKLAPVSPRRCLRCLSGEAGHIKHILG